MLKGGASLFPWSFCTPTILTRKIPWSFCTSDETKTKFSGCRMYRIKEKQYFCVVEPLGWKKNKIFDLSEAYDWGKTKFSPNPRPTIVEKQSFQAFRHLELVGFLCFLFSEALIYSDFLFKSRPTLWFGWFFLKKQTKRDDFGE